MRTVAARLAGKPLPMFRFRDYGSLVSLGELSAVGTLMGRLVGRNLFVQGLIARVMYASLYKLHQRSLHGWTAVALDTLGRFLRGPRRAAREAALTRATRMSPFLAGVTWLLAVPVRGRGAGAARRRRRCPGRSPAWRCCALALIVARAAGRRSRRRSPRRPTASRGTCRCSSCPPAWA